MTDKYSDIKIQNTITTVVEPIVSARLGNETFFNSARTSVTNSRIDSVIRLNISDSAFQDPTCEILSDYEPCTSGVLSAQQEPPSTSRSSELSFSNSTPKVFYPVARMHHMASGTSKLS